MEGIYKHCPQWDETKKRFQAWWAGGSIGRPMIKLRGIRKGMGDYEIPVAVDPFIKHADPQYVRDVINSELASRIFIAESFPHTTINLGAGSLAVYLGSEPNFQSETIWFGETVTEWSSHPPLKIQKENKWWKYHRKVVEDLVKHSEGLYLVDIPDLVENVDILAALRGPQNLCFDLIDCANEIKRRCVQVQDTFDEAYECFYEIVKSPEGTSSFTAFSVWGPGKTAKVQCDFSAMIGPDQFREFIVPMLDRQCGSLDFTVFHLDGPDAMRHAPALMEIDGLNALQWTPGAGNPDGAAEIWYGLYDTVRGAGKSLHIGVYDGSPDKIWEGCNAIVKRYGHDGLYFLLPDMAEDTARSFLEKAEKKWK